MSGTPCPSTCLHLRITNLALLTPIILVSSAGVRGSSAAHVRGQHVDRAVLRRRLPRAAVARALDVGLEEAAVADFSAHGLRARCALCGAGEC